MASRFVAEIRMFGFDFAPFGWAFCDGRGIPISQNRALFSLIGRSFGGDASQFMLPNFLGRCAIAQGTSSSSGQSYSVGDSGGAESVTLQVEGVPAHTHNINVEVKRAAVNPTPDPTQYIAKAEGGTPFYPTNSDTTLAPNIIADTGGVAAHNNLQPLTRSQLLHFAGGSLSPAGLMRT